MTLSQEKMNTLLDEFTKAVEAKKYKRIPYTDWKKLKSAGKCRASFVTDTTTGQTTIAVNRTADGKTVLEFDIADKSFGEFLLTKMFEIGEITIMPPKNNNTLNQIYDYAGNVIGYDSSWNSASTSSTATSTGATIQVHDFNRVYDKTSLSLTDTFVTKSELDAALAKKADLLPTQELTNIKKENAKMKGFNFDFGPCNNNAVKMSLYGLAVKNSTGTWVSYDPKSENIIDVDILNFDGAKYLYKIPTAIKDIALGDVVVHAGKPMFVVGIGANSKSLNVVDPISGEKKEVMLTRSPFGFDFATKIVNFLGNFMDSAATPDNPFGNMWMLMLAQGDNNDISNLLPLMLMNGGTANINPMMMYFLLGNKGGNDSLLPLMFMMNNNNNITTHTCTCGGNCHGKADANA